MERREKENRERERRRVKEGGAVSKIFGLDREFATGIKGCACSLLQNEREKG